MDLLFDNVVPEPLKDQLLDGTLWVEQHVFHQGKTYLVNAPSGKGKSTLLSYIYGLRKDYSGAVHIGDKNAQSLTVDDWSLVRSTSISLLFQDLRLFPQLTARENIELKRKLNPPFLSGVVDEMAEELGIVSLLDKRAGLLSMGQQQRVAFLRCLSQPFQWLLLDEPFSHLDDNNSEIIARMALKYCRQYGAGLILTNLGKSLPIQFDREVKV